MRHELIHFFSFTLHLILFLSSCQSCPNQSLTDNSEILDKFWDARWIEEKKMVSRSRPSIPSWYAKLIIAATYMEGQWPDPLKPWQLAPKRTKNCNALDAFSPAALSLRCVFDVASCQRKYLLSSPFSPPPSCRSFCCGPRCESGGGSVPAPWGHWGRWSVSRVS